MTDVRFLLGIRAQPDDLDLSFVAPDALLAARDERADELADVAAGYAGGALDIRGDAVAPADAGGPDDAGDPDDLGGPADAGGPVGAAGPADPDDAGPGVLRVTDTLRYLVLGLCFHAVPALVRGEEFVYDYAESGFPAVVLRPRGDEVGLSGRFVTSLTCPRLALARALLSCGEDYVRFLRTIGAHPADLTVLTDAADGARAALGAGPDGAS